MFALNDRVAAKWHPVQEGTVINMQPVSVPQPGAEPVIQVEWDRGGTTWTLAGDLLKR